MARTCLPRAKSLTIWARRSGFGFGISGVLSGSGVLGGSAIRRVPVGGRVVHLTTAPSRFKVPERMGARSESPGPRGPGVTNVAGRKRSGARLQDGGSRRLERLDPEERQRLGHRTEDADLLPAPRIEFAVELELPTQTERQRVRRDDGEPTGSPRDPGPRRCSPVAARADRPATESRPRSPPSCRRARRSRPTPAGSRPAADSRRRPRR